MRCEIIRILHFCVDPFALAEDRSGTRGNGQYLIFEFHILLLLFNRKYKKNTCMPGILDSTVMVAVFSVRSATIYSAITYYSNACRRECAGCPQYFDGFDTRNRKNIAGVYVQAAERRRGGGERGEKSIACNEYATNAGQNKYSNASRSFAVCTFMLLSYPFSIKKCNMRCARPRQQDQQQQQPRQQATQL